MAFTALLHGIICVCLINKLCMYTKQPWKAIGTAFLFSLESGLLLYTIELLNNNVTCL